MENNNSNKLLGWDAMVGALSTQDNKQPIIEEEISDEELERLKKGNRGPSVKDVFGVKSVKPGASITDEEVEDLDEEDEEDGIEEEVEEEEVVVKPKAKTKKVEIKPEETAEEEEVEELDEEGIQVSAFFDAVAEELDLTPGEDESKPQTVEDLVTYFKDLIEENSVPTYANDQVKELDEFVRNGGKMEDFYKVAVSIDYDTFDIADENNQKLILKEFLTEKGFTDKRIAQKLEKYEDAGILEDEAEEALELMKEITIAKKEQLLEQQKKSHTTQVEHQQKFVDDVVNNIKTLKDVRGIAIPEKDKKSLLQYIFKADAEGLTQYQKDYSKSVKNLIESAYFTMKGDTLLDTAKKIGTSSAIKTLKQSLKSTGAVKGAKRINTSSSNSIWSIAARNLSNI